MSKRGGFPPRKLKSFFMKIKQGAHRFFLLAAFLLVLPFFPLVARAGSGQSDQVIIASDQVLDDNLMVGTGFLDIQGTVKGDVVAGAGQVVIDGLVEGDVIVAGGQINIAGEVTGDVRVAGGNITLNGKVGKNVNVFGGTVTIDKDAAIGGSVLYGAGVLTLNGKVARDIYGGAGTININGEVGRRATVFSEGNGDAATIQIGSAAKIGDGIRYAADREVVISAGAQVQGEVQRFAAQITEKKDTGLGAASVIKILIRLFSAWLVGLVFIYLFKNHLDSWTSTLQQQPWKALGWGFALLFLGPIFLIIVALSVIGIPLALMLFALWLIVIYLSNIIVGLTIGRMMFSRAGKDDGKKEKKIDWRWPMMAGVGVLVILMSIPVVGMFVSLLAILFGTGIMWMNIMAVLKHEGATAKK